MNIVDLIICLIISSTMLIGLYNGSVVSAMHTVGSFLSWVVSIFIYPLISKLILKTFPSLFETITLYVEGSEKIVNVEDRLAPLHTISFEKFQGIMEQAQVPEPFNRVLLSDFAQNIEGIQTLGEYFDTTMALVIVNIFSILIAFVILKVLFTIILSITKTIVDMPVLKKFDGAAGAGFGLVRGFFILNILFAMMPILIMLFPADILNKFLDGSKLADIFNTANIFTGIISGR